MSLAETGSTSSTAPSRRALGKLRRNQGLASASTTSLVSGSGDGDGDDIPSGRRLSTLVSMTKRKIHGGDRNAGLDGHLSIEAGNVALSGNRSDSSLPLDDSGRSSSLLTDDETTDPATGKPIRPPLSPHQSHTGYLTLSSPEINAQTNPVIAAPDTIAASDAVLAADRHPNIPHIIEPSTVESPSTPAGPERSPSPGKRLRGAFTLPRKKSGDADSVDPASGAGGWGGLFKPSSRRNSLISGLASAPQSTEDIPAATAVKEKTQLDKGQQRPETPNARPSTAVSTELPFTPPNLLDTPTTLVTPPTPTDSSSSFPAFAKNSGSPQKASANRPLSSVDSIKHRRAQSANIPSKLSTSINSPLTPHIEETKSPGGTLTQPNSSTGFFSSLFSAASKTADQLSTSINTTILPNQKSKQTPAQLVEVGGGEEVIPGSGSRAATGAEENTSKPLAVETLGKGDLSFSHLGISDHQATQPMSSVVDLSQVDGEANSDRSRKVEEEAAARAVSSAYEKSFSTAVNQTTGRPLSIASNERLTLNGEKTPPRAAPHDPESIGSGVKRSGSVRSRLSGRRKHRGSSATAGTGKSIAAAIKDSTSGLANPGVHGSGHRLTGFAVASSKRNKDFHQLFRSVPEDDYLIEDYSAALQRDILLHGRLYVSEGHVCFSSNILGWVTNLVISFDEIVSAEKKNTAVIFPNAIVISTLQARNTFASFVARDSTYELLIGIWKINHPNLKSSLLGVVLDDSGTGDKTEIAEPIASGEDTEGDSEDEIYDEDADDDGGSFTDGGLVASNAGSDFGDFTTSRKTSAVPVSATPIGNGGAVPKGLESADAVVTAAAHSSEFPGVPTHEPTQCSDSAEHYDRPLTDTTIPAPLGKVYSVMFGPASGAFMRKWLVEDQKIRDLNYIDDKTGLDNDHLTFTFDYVKPLSGPVGPKQTRCITTNTLKFLDLEKAVSIDCSTQTPDVPSGNVFTTKTRYCLMWGPGNSTRIIASCAIEWTGKSWLKGPIEKGANDGQIDYVTHIVAALKAAVTTKPPVKGMPRRSKRKGRKDQVFDAEEANTQREAAIAAEQKPATWGALEPVHQILEIVSSLVQPLITSKVIIACLFALLAYTWLASPRATSGVGYPGHGSPARLAAYEEIWRREESALWDWIEDRVGVEGVHTVPLSDSQKSLRARNMGKKLEDERMSERQISEAIRTTEERLAALKVAVARKDGKGKA